MTDEQAIDAAHEYATAAMNRDSIANAIAKEVVHGLPPATDGVLVEAYRRADAEFRKHHRAMAALTVEG